MVTLRFAGLSAFDSSSLVSAAGFRISGNFVRDLVSGTIADQVGPPTAGFVVSKAIGGAVVRNRVKRRLRHLMSARIGSLPAGSRVVSVLVGTEPLDPAAKYKVATNDFMMAGGDGYTALSKGTVLIDKSAGSLMASDVIDYITAAKTVSPAVEGRIVIKK